MSGQRKPWHSGTYAKQAESVRRRAYANPSTTCMCCGMTLAEAKRINPNDGWDAGHVIDGLEGGELRAQLLTHNRSKGATRGNRMRVQGVTRQW